MLGLIFPYLVFSQSDCLILNTIWTDLGGSSSVPVIPNCCNLGTDMRLSCRNNRIIAMDFSNRQLPGTLPASIAELTELESLALDRNNITGSIPSTLNNLKNLKFLYLSQNQLSGTIPDLGSLSNLKELYDWFTLDGFIKINLPVLFQRV